MVVNLRNWAYRCLSSSAIELAEESIFRSQSDEWKQLAHTGCHRLEGILILHGADVTNADMGVAQMVDVAPTIMRLLGLPVPDDWDGRVLEAALGADAADPVAAGKEAHQGGETVAGKQAYSQEDEEEIRKRLKNLGYL